MRKILLHVIRTWFLVVCFSATCIISRADIPVGETLADSLQPELPDVNWRYFDNVNEKRYYYDKKSLEKIRKFDSDSNWVALYHEMKDYVKSFGMQNFYKDTRMIWQLARLTEYLGDSAQAKDLYKLVLKHHRVGEDISQMRSEYDSLNKNEADLYIPLDYYYELVEYRRDVDTLRPPPGIRLNMGHLINSKHSDYGPILNFQNNLLIFTSRRNAIEKIGLPTKQNEDIYISQREGGQWEEAQPLHALNTINNEGSVCISKDGKTMYFSRCDAPDTYGNCDIFVTRLQQDSTWGEPQSLGNNVNSVAWDSHPTLSHTGDTLFFASDRIGGFGLSDIYYTTKDRKGRWTRAKNVGPIINTRQNEVSPFYHPVHDVLYFSSNGHLLNFGAFDIYKSYKKKHFWEDPQNLGPLVNSENAEFYFTIDVNSQELFYARSIDNDMSNLDLYSFPLPMEGQPTATTKFRGSLRETGTNKPFSGIVSIIDVENGVEVAPKFLRPDGTFEFDLINNNKYLLVIQGDEFFRVEELFQLSGDTTINKTTESISSRLKFSSIEFENGKWDLKSDMYHDLDKVANFLMDNPDFKLRISGHTDSSGDPDFNLKLSRKRAESIREYIVYFGGISPARIEAIGYGSTQPIVKEEETDKDRSLNRRVEFEIYRPSKKELERIRQKQQEELEGW